MTRTLHLHALARTGLALALALLLAGLVCRTAHAAWPDDGVAAASGTISQYLPVACSDDAGGVFIVWRQANIGQPEALRAQRVDANGNLLWAAGGVALAPAAGNQRVPQVLSMGDGGAIVVWEDNRSGNYDIYAQRLTGTGAVAPGWPAAGLALASRVNHELDPVIVTDGAGGAFVAWDFLYSMSDMGVYAGHVSGTGVIDPLWPSSGLPVCANGNWQGYPAVASDGTGGFYMAWQDSSTAEQESNVYGTRILATGAIAPGWTAGVKPICTAAGRQGVPSLAADGSGGVLVAWRDFRADASGDIWAMRLNAAAIELWTHDGVPVCQAANAQGDNWRVPMVAAGDGGAILAWEDAREPLTTGSDIWGQRIDPMGFPCWAVNGLPLCIMTGRQAEPSMCADQSGGVYVVWTDERGGMDVFGQHVVADGRIVWPLAGLPYCTAGGGQNWPVAVFDQNEGAIAVWQDARGGDDDIYAGDRSGRVNLLVRDTPPGWDAPVVPRNQGGALETSVQVTPVLDGNVEATWFNYHTDVIGPNPVPEFAVLCLVDGAIMWWSAFSDGALPKDWMLINLPPQTVRGGRHTVTLLADPQQAIPETDEGDNDWMGQWVWSPLALTGETPVVRGLPPWWGDMALPDVDGFAFGRTNMSMAWVVSVAARETGSDCDLYLFDDYVGSMSGFSNLRAWSELGGTATDFVVGHFTSSPNVFYPGVCQYGTTGWGNYSIDAAEATAHQGPSPPRDWSGMPLLPGRLADVYELYMTAGTTHYVSVARDVGSSTLELSLFPATHGGIYGRGQAVATSIPASPAVAQLVYTAPTSGWYPLVVYPATGDLTGDGARYSLHWATHPLVDVPTEPVAGYTLAFEGARPNPARGSTALTFTLSRDGAVRLEIFDARGRLVRSLAGDEPLLAGPHRLVWDGRTDDGALAASGIHWARLTAEGRTFVRKVALLR